MNPILPPRPRHPTAFTLVEVLVCIGIFAIGFAAIAMMLPTGAVMQRGILAKATGDIVGKNALEIVKGKGVYALCWNYHAPSTSITTAPMPMGFGGEKHQFFFSDAVHNQPGAYPWYLNGPDAAVMAPYLNPAANGVYIKETGVGWRVSNWGNATNYAYGVVHAFTNRNDRFSNLDFSYPSSVLDFTARSYFCNLLLSNLSSSPNPTGEWAYHVCVPGTDQWRLTAVTLLKPSTGEWPEQCESDTANPDGQGTRSTSFFQFNGSGNAVMLTSSTGVDMRSIGGDPALAGKPDPNAVLWRRYWKGSASMGTVPKTGGDPGNADPWFRGSLSLTVASWINSYGADYGPAWNHYSLGYYISPPVREDGSASEYPYTDPIYNKAVGWKAPNIYRYPIPAIASIHATLYDRDNDLVLLRYPLCFARTLRDAPNLGTWKASGNARVKAFQAAIGGDAGTGTGWVDRKLKVGDTFMLQRGSYPFIVKEVLDASSEAARVNAAIGDQVDWSDGTYAIVRVSPSLRTTTYTANMPNLHRHISSWTQPDPIGALVAPPPVSGGPSPWVSTLQLDDGGTVNQSLGAFTRPWNCLTN